MEDVGCVMKPEYLRYSVKAKGQYGEKLQAKGTLELTHEWIDPPSAAAVAAGVVEGINAAAYKSDMQGSPFGGSPMTITITLRYPKPKRTPE